MWVSLHLMLHFLEKKLTNFQWKVKKYFLIRFWSFSDDFQYQINSFEKFEIKTSSIVPPLTLTKTVAKSYICHWYIVTISIIYIPNVQYIAPIYHPYVMNQGHITVIQIWKKHENPDLSTGTPALYLKIVYMLNCEVFDFWCWCPLPFGLFTLFGTFFGLLH